MVKVGRIWAVLLAGMLCYACSDEENDVICTDEFRTISVKLVGGDVDSFYTIRKATSDTIVYAPDNVFLRDNFYPVLDDNYQQFIANSREVFIFEVWNDGTRILSEEYVIEADDCHIFLVEGRKEIDLSAPE